MTICERVFTIYEFAKVDEIQKYEKVLNCFLCIYEQLGSIM